MNQRKLIDSDLLTQHIEKMIVEEEECEGISAFIVASTLKKVHQLVKGMPEVKQECSCQEWRNPETDPPKVETEVLVLCSCGTGYCITTAFYEDGTVLQNKSRWYFEDIEDYGIYDEENDEYRIPKGWWENRHYCPDDVPDYKVDDLVVGWMPLPEPNLKGDDAT